MILIDRLKEFQTILLTQDGREIIPTLFLKSDANRKEISLPLDDDQSANPDRYSSYIMNNNLFSGLDDGYYAYEIRELLTGDLVESGKLFIKPTAPELTPAASIETDVLIFTKQDNG